MTKKYITISIVAVLVACMSSSASAQPFAFTNFMDIDEYVSEYSAPVVFTHDLLFATPPVNVPLGDVVNSARLVVEFEDEYDGSSGAYEYAWVQVDDTINWMWVEVNSASYGINGDVAWLLDDGLLKVEVRIRNDWDMRRNDVIVASSTLTGTYTPVPVPGAILLGMLGLSVVGVKLRKKA